MARPRVNKVTPPSGMSEAAAHWQRLRQDPETLQTADAGSRRDAWLALAWAQENVHLDRLPVPVPADRSDEALTLVVVMRVLSHPPADVPASERLERVRAWAQTLRYPMLDALHGVLAVEAGQIRQALAIFERSKTLGAAFPEVPLTAGRALLGCAGNDPKLLHKAEWYLMHAEHLLLNGDEEPQDGENVDDENDDVVVVPEQDLDEVAQRRLAETWTLMARLYARLGDLEKSEMYGTRAGSCAELLAEETEPEETETEDDDLAREKSLKPTDRKLIRSFFESSQFRDLSPGTQRQARSAIPTFVALGRQYLAVGPARLDRYSLEELLVALIPERMVAPVEQMALVPPAIIAWIHFLGKSGQMRDAGRLGALVQRMGADYMANCRNPEHWGMAKTMAMRMLQSGVDIDDPREVDRWLQDRPVRLMAG